MNNNDTLFEDATGHCPDMFDHITEDGLNAVVEMLQMSPSDMGMEDETFRLFAIEVICASGGQPSASSECAYIREWCEQNPASVDSSVKEKMLSIIDGLVSEGEDEDVASKMRSRINNLA